MRESGLTRRMARGFAVDRSRGSRNEHALSVPSARGFALALFVALASGPVAAQTVQWRRVFGTSGDDAVWASAPAGFGGVYVSGYTEGSLGGPNAGNTDAWLARFDGSGSRLWIRQFGSAAYDWSTAAAADGLQGVFVGGITFGDLGGPN